jgi:Rad3-related DNA helicase
MLDQNNNLPPRLSSAGDDIPKGVIFTMFFETEEDVKQFGSADILTELLWRAQAMDTAELDRLEIIALKREGLRVGNLKRYNVRLSERDIEWLRNNGGSGMLRAIIADVKEQQNRKLYVDDKESPTRAVLESKQGHILMTWQQEDGAYYLNGRQVSSDEWQGALEKNTPENTENIIITAFG